MNRKRVVVLDVVGLTPKHFETGEDLPNLAALLDAGQLYRMKTIFPAVTLPVQASLTTGVFPEAHGIVANGFHFSKNHQVAFWEQAASLVRAERIWDRIKARNPELRTAVLFMQNTLYATADAVITPRPLHSESGLIQWCYSKPVGLYEDIAAQIGPFNLMHYWGPLASIESSRWIAKAAVETMARMRPDLMFVYLPHLDYCCQRFGPDDPVVRTELRQVDQEVGRIVSGIDDLGMRNETIFLVLSEYAFHKVTEDIPLNRILRANGLLQVRTIQGREYLDLELSPAFAMVDHQIAQVYCKPTHEAAVRAVLEKTAGIDFILDREGQKQHRAAHPRSGNFIAVSARDRWFSYYWWEDRAREPDFATKVDIHAKPGYDPLELFLEPGTRQISQNTALICGSHGYPPIAEEDRVTLLVSGRAASDLALPEELAITDVAGLIEALVE